ncbi:MAG: ribosome maturation factor RimP [Desulfobulbaceae bacterium]
MNTATENIITAVEKYATPLLADMGLELVEVQYRTEGHGWVLRLFIDREGGVTVDDCAAVSREISAWLDVEDLIEHAYHLEVSSPGLERPLNKIGDFERFAGRRARIKLREPLEGRKVFVGTIGEADGGGVVLETEAGPVRLEFDAMAKARLTLD